MIWWNIAWPSIIVTEKCAGKTKTAYAQPMFTSSQLPNATSATAELERIFSSYEVMH